jgi:arginine exporter protein ArgO
MSFNYFFASSNSGKIVFPVGAFCYATLLWFFLIGIVRGKKENEKNY